MAIGADVSPLGIGIKSALVLSHDFDARLMGNFFNYQSADYEVQGFHVAADLHMASMAAALDWYPYGSVFRISPGLMFYNGNQISGTMLLTAGTEVDFDSVEYFSPTANQIAANPGATPLAGSGVVGMHTRQPAMTITGGFGHFIPRSNRHWSFPAEFGVAFTGPPVIAMTFTGWVCTSKTDNSSCNSVATTGSTFNTSLQTQLAKWQKSMNLVTIYPIFSTSVVYSFNIR
jgi:hypothetical protein